MDYYLVKAARLAAKATIANPENRGLAEAFKTALERAELAAAAANDRHTERQLNACADAVIQRDAGRIYCEPVPEERQKIAAQALLAKATARAKA